MDDLGTARMRSLADHLSLVRPFVDQALVDDRAFDDLRRLSSGLPASLPTIALECRLGAPEPSADFQIQVACAQDLEAVIEADGGTPTLSQPARAALRRLAASWGSPTSNLSRALDHVWLEFDLIGGTADGGPGVFLAPAIERVKPRPGVSEPIARAVAWLLGMPRAPSVDALRACCVRLPTSSRVFAVGCLLGRGDPAPIRLCVAAISPGAIETCVKDLGWAGSPRLLKSTLQRLYRVADEVTLNLDVASGIGATIGCEAFVWQARDPQRQERWRRLLDALVSDGLCVAAKRDAILRFPGDSLVGEQAAAPAQWTCYHRRLRRIVHHVKLTVHVDGDLGAKAYLCSHLVA